MNKLQNNPHKLGDITRKIFVGLQTSADKIYVMEVEETGENTIKCFSKSLNKTVEIEKGLLKPFLMGKDVKRYHKPKPKNVVIFPYLISSGKAELMTRQFIKTNYPLGWGYLSANKKELENRENGKMKREGFYAYIYPKNLTEFESVKIMTPEIAIKPQLTMDLDGGIYHTTKVYGFAFNENINENIKYFLGILNSPLLPVRRAKSRGIFEGSDSVRFNSKSSIFGYRPGCRKIHCKTISRAFFCINSFSSGVA